MDPGLKEELKRIAAKEDRTMSRQIIHWVSEKIAEYGSSEKAP